MMVVMMPPAGLAVGSHTAFHFAADLVGRFGLNGGVGDAMLGQLGADGGLGGGGVAVYDGVEGGVVAASVQTANVDVVDADHIREGGEVSRQLLHGYAVGCLFQKEVLLHFF